MCFHVLVHFYSLVFSTVCNVYIYILIIIFVFNNIKYFQFNAFIQVVFS